MKGVAASLVPAVLLLPIGGEALLRAVAINQATGFAGMPLSHFSSATANASWTTSSARSKSPSIRIIVAVTRPDTSRKTRSTAVRALVMHASVRPAPYG